MCCCYCYELFKGLCLKEYTEFTCKQIKVYILRHKAFAKAFFFFKSSILFIHVCNFWTITVTCGSVANHCVSHVCMCVFVHVNKINKCEAFMEMVVLQCIQCAWILTLTAALIFCLSLSVCLTQSYQIDFTYISQKHKVVSLQTVQLTNSLHTLIFRWKKLLISM